jgi:hypothetical protein
VIKVINEFRIQGRSFVTPAENVELTEYTVIDISHESLMRVWDRLKGWVEEETNSVLMYLRLSEAASLYQLGKTGLWRPPDLQLALNWKKTQQPSLAWAKKYNPAFEKVMVFLDASEKKFLQEEQNKIKLQRRTLNRTRRFATFMGITAIAFMGLMAYALGQKREAEKQKDRAEVYASIMEQQKNVAVEEKDIKELERLRAMVGKDSAERAQMSALLKLSEVKVEANQMITEVKQQSEVMQKTTEQARMERELAEKTARQALEEQSKAEQATSAEKRTRMLTTAQTMSIKAIQTENKDLKGLLAYQAYRFNEQYNGPDNNPDVYKGLYNVMAAYQGTDFNSLNGHEGSVKSLAFMPSQNIVYSSGADGNIIKWDLNQGSKKGMVLIHNNFSNRSLAISSNGRWLACGTGTSIIQVFNLNQPNTDPRLFEAHKGAVVDLSFINGKDILVSVGSDKTILYWNLLTDEKRTIVTHSTRIRTICLSDDGNYVYGGTDDGILIRWNISDGEAKEIYDNKQQAINALTISGTGSRIAFGDISGNIIILETISGKKLSQVKGHTARIQDIAYSPDNSQLATSSFDGTIRIWNAAKLSENPVIITEHESWALAIAFSPDGRTLVSSSEKGVVFYWSSKTKYMADQVCNYVSRNFTDQEWDIYVGMDIDYQKTCSNRE